MRAHVVTEFTGFEVADQRGESQRIHCFPEFELEWLRGVSMSIFHVSFHSLE